MKCYIYKNSNPNLNSKTYSIPKYFSTPTRVKYLYIDWRGRGYEGYGIAYKSDLILGHSGQAVSLNRVREEGAYLFISKVLPWKSMGEFLSDKDDTNTNVETANNECESENENSMKIDEDCFIDLDEIVEAIIL